MRIFQESIRISGTPCGTSWNLGTNSLLHLQKVVLLECLTGISDAETSSQIMGISEVVGCGVGLEHGLSEGKRHGEKGEVVLKD